MQAPSLQPPPTAWWQPLFVGVLFYFGAVLAVETTAMTEGVVFLWPSNAVLLAALLRSPRQRWPAFMLAALLAEWAADHNAFTTLQALLFGSINVFEATFAALWLGRCQPGRFAFDRLRNVVCFAVGVLIVSCALAGAAGGLVYRHSTGGTEPYWAYWQLWWLGDGLGMLLLLPVLLAWLDASPWKPYRRTSRWELAALLLLTGGASWLVFSNGGADQRTSLAWPVLLFPLVIWVASRFGTRSVAALCLLVGAIAIEFTRRSIGPFADAHVARAVMQLQTFMLSLSISGLAIAAVLSELRQRNADLRLRDRAIESIGEGVVIVDARLPDMPITYVNPSFEALTGYSAAEVLGRNCRFLQGNDRQQAGLVAIHAALQRGEPARVLLRNYRKDGRLFLNDLVLTPVRDDDQQLCAYVGIQRDVTALREAEIRLREAHADLSRTNLALEQRVAERTRALELLNQQLANLAHTDSLTGIWNRRYFLEAARRGISTCERHGHVQCLLMIDVDHFKAINDRHGHSVGDQALIALIQAIQATLRPTDVFARFGGEEFVALLTDTAQLEAIRVAERWRLAVARQQIHHQGKTIAITVSIGVVQWQPGIDLDHWIRLADERLYEAKAKGRNRVCG